MDLDTAITAWEQDLTRQTGLAATSITQYVRDARRFATWLAEHAPAGGLADVTPGDAREYRDTLLCCALVVLPPPSIVP
jgi:site-specific recombinase XerD